MFPPLGSTTKGPDPEATPFALAAGEIQVLNRNDDGTIDIFSKQLNQVCPVAADSCGLSDTLDVTHVGSLGSKGQLDAIVSPDRGQMVVVEQGSGANAIYVLPLKTTEPARTPDASASDTTAATAPAASPVAPATATTTTAAPSASPSAGTEASPSASDEQAPSAEPRRRPPSRPHRRPPARTPRRRPPTRRRPPRPRPPRPTRPRRRPPTPKPTRTRAAPSEAPTEAPSSPAPSVEVTPGPDGAIEIARDVVIVGSVAAYSPDGTQFAFSARPVRRLRPAPTSTCGTSATARPSAVTTDHGSQLAGWIGGRLLVSRVVDGTPRTSVLDLSDNSQRSVHDGAMWRPTVGPGRKTAAWWDGIRHARRTTA